MTDPAATSVIAEGGTEALREIQRVLARAGIAAELVRPPRERCGT